MVKDEQRACATVRRTRRLLERRAGRYAHVMAIACRARLAAAAAAKAVKFSEAVRRGQAASKRRAAFLDYTTAKARACGASHGLTKRTGATEPAATPTAVPDTTEAAAAALAEL